MLGLTSEVLCHVGRWRVSEWMESSKSISRLDECGLALVMMVLRCLLGHQQLGLLDFKRLFYPHGYAISMTHYLSGALERGHMVCAACGARLQAPQTAQLTNSLAHSPLAQQRLAVDSKELSWLGSFHLLWDVGVDIVLLIEVPPVVVPSFRTEIDQMLERLKFKWKGLICGIFQFSTTSQARRN